MNARAKQLFELGLKTFNDDDGSNATGLIKAFAVMLSAPAPSRKALAAEAGPALPFSVQEMHQMLLARVGHLVVCDLVNGSVFGHLGRKLKGIAGLTRADLDHLVSWIEAGGLAWMTTQPTFQSIVHNCDKWFATAREWDRRGRQTLRRGGSNVGAGDGAEPVRDMSMFK